MYLVNIKSFFVDYKERLQFIAVLGIKNRFLLLTSAC
jgi:hypothetical protein